MIREDSSCDFCEIARGRTGGVEAVAEAEEWIAFFPKEPATPGHTLLIPRLHTPDLWSAPPVIASRLMEGATGLGRAIIQAVKPDGMNLITSSGSAAEQTVFHLHLHLVPRWHADGFGPIWPAEGERLTNGALARLANEIHEAWLNISGDL
ncbi:MAG: HIT family protein [Actinomycetota bacterium]|nr:HIT family protein [Actinomycetota bacterium]